MTEQEKMYVSLRNEYNELDVQVSEYRARIAELEAENAQLKSEIVSLKEQQMLDIRAEFGIIEARIDEVREFLKEELLRFNPYHDEKGRFTSSKYSYDGKIKEMVFDDNGDVDITYQQNSSVTNPVSGNRTVNGVTYD